MKRVAVCKQTRFNCTAADYNKFDIKTYGKREKGGLSLFGSVVTGSPSRSPMKNKYHVVETGVLYGVLIFFSLLRIVRVHLSHSMSHFFVLFCF